MFNTLQQALTSRPVLYHRSEDLIIPPSNYRNHLKRAISYHPEKPVMNANVQQRISNDGSRPGTARKDTGFPEPLSEERNTTLAHPDADTSPNATIEAPDVDLTRTHSRSFLKRHHSSHNSHSFFSRHESPEKTGLYDNIEYADGTSNEKKLEKTSGNVSPKDSVDTMDGVMESGDKKRGLFRRIGLA